MLCLIEINVKFSECSIEDQLTNVIIEIVKSLAGYLRNILFVFIISFCNSLNIFVLIICWTNVMSSNKIE